MMGTFHVTLTFLVVIATRFKDAGLRDILVLSTVIEGSVDTMSIQQSIKSIQNSL